MNIIIQIIIYAVCGAIAAVIMKSKGGILRNIIMGFIGSFVGGFLAGLLPIPITGGYIVSGLVSIAGACLVIWIGKKFF
ncbi:MAG: GlsB/YeaQ/YmgE family stress response membrane protein [Lachnospiraceae bacterium]|nr:GlsB/YeaQ/YmgE family stress response membrane protein [Lachnospiraceae bacterium]